MTKSYNTKTCEGGRQALQGLNLINSFIFSALTEKPEDAEFIAKLIIERATNMTLSLISIKQPNYLCEVGTVRH